MDKENEIATLGECAEYKRLAYRGGNWNNGTNAGVFALNGNNPRSNVNTNIGFRSALALYVRLRQLKGTEQL